MTTRNWTEEEMRFALTNYGPMTAKEIGERINRSEGAVSKKISTLTKRKTRRPIDVGDTVVVKGFKTPAVVKRLLDRSGLVSWRGWVELDRPLRTFSRWHVSDLEKVD